MEPNYSTIHMQCGPKKDPGEAVLQYVPMTLTGNIFENITIRPIYINEAGGSGLAIRYVKELTLKDCHFVDCRVQSQVATFPSIGGALYFMANLSHPGWVAPTFVLEECTFKNIASYQYGGCVGLDAPTKKFEMINCTCERSDLEGQQTEYGGFLYFGKEVEEIKITGTVFDTAAAKDGGCIYTKVAIQAFTLEHCIISACEAREGGSYSLVVNSANFVLTNVSMQNMQGGRGKIKLSSCDLLTMSNCIFDQYRTGQLVEYTPATEQGVTKFNVSSCNFTSVAIDESSLFFLTNVKEFVLFECVFTGTETSNSDVHIINAESVQTLTVHWTDFMHNDIKGSLIRVNGVTKSMEIKNCDFVNCSSTSHPLVDVSQSSNLQLYDVSFENCTVPDKNSLINLVSVEALTLGPYAYFRGAKEQAGTAAYIKSDKDNVNLVLPVCFDLEAEFSVYFAGAKPWESIENGTGIFECYDAPETPTPSPTPTPTEPAAKKGLSAGAVAGIVIGLLVVMAVLLIVILFLVIRRRRIESSTEEDDPTKHDDTETVTQETLQTADFMGDDNFKVTEDNPIYRSEVFGEANDFTNEFEEHSI